MFPKHVSEDQKLRTCYFRPFRGALGPVFRLHTWDTYRSEGRPGRTWLGYTLQMKDPSQSAYSDILSGEDYGSSPSHAVDSDECVRGLMTFLTLRPGDTDSDYFANYTPEQLHYCEQWAESLSYEVTCRFGEDC